MGIISFLEDHMFTCQWKEHFHMECLGCGTQRAFIHLLKGEFVEAFNLYPAIYTLVFLCGYTLLHIKFNFSQGSKIILSLFIINALIILINYTLKFI
jgi:hypothetical protein